MNGHASKPMVLWNAATAIAQNPWTSQSSGHAPRSRISGITGEKTCIDCHKGIAHHLLDMRGVPGWQ